MKKLSRWKKGGLIGIAISIIIIFASIISDFIYFIIASVAANTFAKSQFLRNLLNYSADYGGMFESFILFLILLILICTGVGRLIDYIKK